MTHPYECSLDLTFPLARQASQVRRIMAVDRELGDRVLRVLTVKDRTVHVAFKATEAKLLRVSVSSFCDYLTVALKCFQEFDSQFAHA
jgi:hypothetical protein